MMLSPKTSPTPTILRLVYENGVFRPVQPVDYQDGQEINVSVLEDTKTLKGLLDSMIEPYPFLGDGFIDDQDEDVFLDELDKLTRGVTLSDAIIEERRSE